MTKFIIISVVLCLSVFGDSKTEVELRRQLIASESARIEGARQVSLALAKLAATSKAAELANKSTTTAQVNAATTADANAVASRSVAEVNGQIASLAAERAMEAANKASEQANKASTQLNNLRYSLYSLLVVTLGGIITTTLSRMQSRHEHDATLKETGEIKRTIVTLEKNTNSIKDALVETTGKAEFARGLKEGKEQ